MKKRLRGKRYLRSRATVAKGRAKRLQSKLKRFIFAMNRLSKSFESVKRKLGRELYNSLKTFIKVERAKDERELLFGTGEGEPVGIIKAGDYKVIR